MLSKQKWTLFKVHQFSSALECLHTVIVSFTITLSSLDNILKKFEFEPFSALPIKGRFRPVSRRSAHFTRYMIFHLSPIAFGEHIEFC